MLVFEMDKSVDWIAKLNSNVVMLYHAIAMLYTKLHISAFDSSFVERAAES